MIIRHATPADFDAIWPIFHSIVKTGDSYAYHLDTSEEEAFGIWMQTPKATYVAEEKGQILATYYLKANQPALGAHVCNCGYMVSPQARGKGLGKALCLHSQEEAKKFGFKAMQFNLVVSSNPAVKLWEKLGFETIGRLPKAFRHKTQGYCDALIMYKWLAD